MASLSTEARLGGSHGQTNCCLFDSAAGDEEMSGRKLERSGSVVSGWAHILKMDTISLLYKQFIKVMHTVPLAKSRANFFPVELKIII